MSRLPSSAVTVASGASSGLLLLLAFPPADQRWVAFVAPVPLLLALRQATWWQGFLAGFAYGWAFFGILVYWISGFGLIAWGALSIVLALYGALFGALGALVARAGLWGRLLGLPALWAGVEMIRGRFPFGGFPWGSLGYSQQAGGSTLPVARLGGVYLLGLVIFAVSALVAEGMVVSRLRARAGLGVAAVALVLVPALLPFGLAGAQTGLLDVAAVQGNVPRGSFTGFGRGGRTGPEDPVIVRNHLEVSRRLLDGAPPDLVVWPENAFDRDPRLNARLFEPVQDLIRELGAPFIIGAILDDPDGFRNANLFVDPAGEVAGRYDKTHLVPFGEYVPFAFARNLVPVLDQEIPEDGIPGEELVVFDVDGGRVGTVICFESIFPALVRDVVRAGAQVIVVTTNNASYGTSPAAAQHLAMSRMRAIEHGRPVVHAAISGTSAIIGPDGAITERASLFTQALLREEVPLTQGQTPYTRYGAGIEIAMGLGAAAAVAAGVARARRGRGA